MTRRLISLLGLAVMLSSQLPEPIGAEDAPQPFELMGTGSWTIANQMNSWAQTLYPSRQGMNLAFLAKGSRGGRGTFARGEVDFAIAGRPMNDEDLAALAQRRAAVIELPISVGSAAMLMSAPYPGLETFTPDPIDPEEGPGQRQPYESTLKFPMRTISLIFLDNVFNHWLDPEFLAANASAIPPGSVFVSKGNLKYPEPVVRSEGSATNYFMQQALQKYAPTEFGAKLLESQLADFKITESWPFLYTGARSGGANAGLVGSWLSSKGSDSVGGGVITPTSNSEALAQVAAHPTTQLFIAELENAAGEFIAPSTGSISLAIEQGDGVPLAAMNNPIPGAYPLAWVNYLYAPAAGLGIDATNALATFVRYAVTQGQATSAELGEGLLSSRLVAEALAKADAIVAGNCQGVDRKIIAAAEGGPFWPTGIALPAGLATAWPVCAVVSSPAPAVTVAPMNAAPTAVAGSSASNPIPRSAGSVQSVGSPIGVPSGPNSSYSSSPIGSPADLNGQFGTDVGFPVETVSGDDAGGATPMPPADSQAAPLSPPDLIAASLPLGMPDDGRGALDRLSTMVLGAVIVVVGRGIVRRSKAAA